MDGPSRIEPGPTEAERGRLARILNPHGWNRRGVVLRLVLSFAIAILIVDDKVPIAVPLSDEVLLLLFAPSGKNGKQNKMKYQKFTNHLNSSFLY